MCFSAQASLATLIIGLAGSALVFTLNRSFDHIIALYIAYVSLMQGVEYALWSHQTCDELHKWISKIGMILNASQPLVLGLIVLLMSPRALKNSHAILLILAIYSVFAVFYFKEYTKDLQCTTPRPDDPHLVWNWGTLSSYHIWWTIYLVSVVLISILGMPTLNNGTDFALIAALGMGLSILVYPRQDMGAMWCFFTALTLPIYYVYRTVSF
jgi:hypothetical protein